MNTKLKRIVIYSLVGVVIILVALVTYFILRAPVLNWSSLINNEVGVDLKQTITLNFSNSLDPIKTKASVSLTGHPVDNPALATLVSGTGVTISFASDNYLLPNKEYVLNVKPYSKMLGFAGRDVNIYFSTRSLGSEESLPLKMENNILKTVDTFQDGGRKGFEFVTKIPIQTVGFTITDMYELNNGKINVIVKYQNGGSNEDLFTWLKTQGSDTSLVVINQ